MTGTRSVSTTTPRGGTSVLLVLLFSLLSGSAFGATPADSAKEAELKALRERIGSLRGELERVRGRFDAMRVELRDTERQIGEITRNVGRIDEELEASNGRLRELQARRDELSAALDEHRRRIAEHTRAVYAMGQEPQLKILLNQQDPSRVGRLATYYGYVVRARSERIAALTDTLAQVREVEATIATETAELQTLRARRLGEAERLRKSRQERESLVTRLSTEISDRNRQLEQMKSDERELEGVIKSLYEALADVPAEPGNRKPFSSQRGRLPWPTRGPLQVKFGSPRSGGKLAWQGVLIRGKEGQPIQAVSHGRVAFADWLRGYGLMVIIDHGDGFMSLYGHNQSLYKEAGDWVEAGETVAALGDSGGRAEPVLYFEIRHNGQPIDPAQWCRR